ncbi:MAG: site-specific integrase [Candidatus Accumulibacter sp.]|nr:site-specific integrase [Accumulibacter sp.]
MATPTFDLALKRGMSFTFKELVVSYMASYQGSDPARQRHLDWFVESFGDKVASEIDGDDIQDALDELQRRGKTRTRPGVYKALSSGTINRYRSAVQAVLTWGRKRRLMPRDWLNPVGETEALPETNGRVRFLSEDEYQRLLKASKVSKWKKLHVLIKLAVTTGVRRGTLFALTWKDVDLKEKRAYAARTKNGEPFVLVLQDDVASELEALRGKALDHELVFCGRDPRKPMNLEKAWYNALERACLRDVCFHTLRHTHASWLAKKGVPLLVIADSMGHKTLAMTKRYSHLCIDTRAELLSRVFSGIKK